MANLDNFDAAKIEPATEFEVIPSGRYVAAIIGSEMKPTKSGTGAYLELVFELIEGDFKGRRLWSRLNLQNSNPLAVKIARSELSAICRSIGILQPRDSSELHGLPLLITVKQKADDAGELRNEIKGYNKRESGSAAKAPQAVNPMPPWRRDAK